MSPFSADFAKMKTFLFVANFLKTTLWSVYVEHILPLHVQFIQPSFFVTFCQNPVLNLLAHPQVAKILKNMCFADAHTRKPLVIAKCY